MTALLHHPLIVANGAPSRVVIKNELSEGVGQGFFTQHFGELVGVVVPWGEGES